MAELKNLIVSEDARFNNMLTVQKITELGTPTENSDIATKAYVDEILTQLV